MRGEIRISDYYDTIPSVQYCPGDVWMELPTFGILTAPALPGLVITPACDLANRKVETLTYLPVVPVSEYLQSRAVLGKVLQETQRQLDQIGLDVALAAPDAFLRSEDLTAALILVREAAEGFPEGSSQRSAADRCRNGVELASAIVSGEGLSDPVSVYRALFGQKAFRALAEKIVTNSLSMDLHFLPADGQLARFSAIPQPAVALFRYPLTFPIEVLDVATACSEDGWESERQRLAGQYPCVQHMGHTRPLKALRVRPRFISDLLTRFTALYGRLGSPDFTESTVQRFVREIGGEA